MPETVARDEEDPEERGPVAKAKAKPKAKAKAKAKPGPDRLRKLFPLGGPLPARWFAQGRERVRR